MKITRNLVSVQSPNLHDSLQSTDIYWFLVSEMLYFSTPPRAQGVLEIPRKRYGYIVRCESGLNKPNFGLFLDAVYVARALFHIPACPDPTTRAK
jgi:hypothetical protein